MQLDIKRDQLMLIWSDVGEALEIMAGFEKNKTKPADVRKRAKTGLHHLTRANKMLTKLAGMKKTRRVSS
jgi:hypothetical protein